MGELIKKLIGFFESDKVSVFRKIAIPVLIVLCLLSLDNILGVSYYFVNGMEVDYIVRIEDAKDKCNSDSIALLHFDNMMKDAIHRKNAFQWFASLFENSNTGCGIEDNISSDEGFLSSVEKIFPTLERNQLWHTLTSSLLWIIAFGGLLLFLAFSPFFIEKDKAATIVGMIFGLGLLVFLIWITQWLFGLIPVIFDRAYINYSLQLGLNLIPIVALTIGSIKESRKKKNL